MPHLQELITTSCTNKKDYQILYQELKEFQTSKERGFWVVKDQ